MTLRILSIVSLIALVSCNSPNKLENNDEGWTPLFDGKTMSGWHTYGETEAGKAWEVKDGTIHLNINSEEGRGDLVTDKEYENFHLKVEWKISEGGNSGIIFNVHEDKTKYANTYNTGPEMQVLDNDKHADGKIHKHRTGDLYDLIPSTKETVKPVGEWNEAEIVSDNGKLEFFLNGEKVVSTTMYDDNWKNLIAGSKFVAWPDFGTYKKGKIALQDHGDEVWFRNVKIKEI